ncbi:MAG TPA: 16S rRNA (adenine(1518)-N(6)/adenine(1519)-N(6))-dimethyltransferase RsmA [Casimicrobiaceae bacterium]|nr:16S rRNA (adenine(1518)-N(6)/adenine(1519)-N(6))-dimethyltransferase RsmA [Casimicrobiaceae bacterium]
MRGHSPRRRFGQNFLADPHYVAKIVAAVDPRAGDNVVEIGPGLAALTGGLVAGAKHIAAIEIDRDLAARLRAEFTSEQLTLYEADALAFDYAQLGTHLRIVGNLPYNISTPLLFHLFTFVDRLRDLHIMLQREVIARMTAAPATPEYGRLSVMVQAQFAVTRLFIVPPGAFRPAPEVDSAVARLVPLADAAPRIANRATFARIVAAAFGQRRKTLRNALAGVCDTGLLQHVGIDPGARGETLSVDDYARLANESARLEAIDRAAPQVE